MGAFDRCIGPCHVVLSYCCPFVLYNASQQGRGLLLCSSYSVQAKSAMGPLEWVYQLRWELGRAFLSCFPRTL